MTYHAPLLLALASLTGWCLFLSVVLDRPELLLVAVPLFGALLSARSSPTPARVRTTLEASRVRLCEGDALTVTLTVASSMPVPMLEVLLTLPPNIVLTGGNNRFVFSLGAGNTIRRTLHLRAIGRGRSRLGGEHMRLSDRSGLLFREAETDRGIAIEVFPTRDVVRHLPYS